MLAETELAERLGDDAGADEIRARLLGTPVWVYEWGQPIVHPDDPQFAPVRAELGRLYLQPKADSRSATAMRRSSSG